MNHLEIQQQKREKERIEQLKKQADPNQPTNVAKYQHELAQKLLKEQHSFNIELHEKQADLARELHKKQSRLTKFTTILTILAALLGVVLGSYLPSSKLLPLAPKLLQGKVLQKQSGPKQISENLSPYHHKEGNKLKGQAANTLKTVSSRPPKK